MRVSHNGYCVVIYVLCKYIVLVVNVFFEAHSKCMTGIHTDGFLHFFFSDKNYKKIVFVVKKDKSCRQADFQEL